jgi:cytochrome c oxidase assembly factor CtaG
MQVVGIVSLALAMVAVPVSAALGLRRRRRVFLWPRLALALVAAAVTLGALLGLDGAADSMLSGHMLQHVLIGDLVPLLLVLAIRPPLLPRLPVRPAVAFAVWAGTLAFWHIPAVYDRALEREPLHAFEHLTFLLAGLLVWTALLDRRALEGWRRFGYTLALLAASGVLANTLILSYRPLYPSYAEATSRPFGLTPVHDQDLAGVVMMLEQLATLGTFAFLSARRQLAAEVAARPERHPLAA